jgi:hypothetical protein
MRSYLVIAAALVLTMGCTAEASPTSSSVAVEPTPPADCINPPPDIATLSDQADPVACYGDAPIIVDAYLTGSGVVDWMVVIEPAWLGNPTAGALYLVGETRKVGAPFLLVGSDPASGVSLQEHFDSNVRITGHYDDPAAQTCVETGRAFGETPGLAREAIEFCRRTFVVTDVVPLAS